MTVLPEHSRTVSTTASIFSETVTRCQGACGSDADMDPLKRVIVMVDFQSRATALTICILMAVNAALLPFFSDVVYDDDLEAANVSVMLITATFIITGDYGFLLFEWSSIFRVSEFNSSHFRVRRGLLSVSPSCARAPARREMRR